MLTSDGSTHAEPRVSIELTANDLSFRYRGAGLPVLSGVTFQVGAGQVLGVLGANGSGKSTLLNALLDVRMGERDGEVRIAGEPIAGRRNVGLATQHVALYQRLTVVENLRHFASIRLPRRLASKAVDDAVDEHNLRRVAKTPVHQLSGGWRRLTHIATSFVHRPLVRLLDEPTTALDFQARGRLVELTKQWRRDGALLLVTSHYPEDIQELCTHAMVLRGGRLAWHGTLANLLSRQRRTLVVEVTTDTGTVVMRHPAPQTAKEARDVLDRMLAAEGRLANGQLQAIRIADSTRELLASDPQLRKVDDDNI